MNVFKTKAGMAGRRKKMNDFIIFFAMSKFCELINKDDDVDLSETVDILNNILQKIEPGSENFIEKVEAVTGLILEVKASKENADREKFRERMFNIQQLFNLNRLYNQNKKAIERKLVT